MVFPHEPSEFKGPQPVPVIQPELTLEELLHGASSLPPTSKSARTVFDGDRVPDLELGLYLDRLRKYMVLEDYHSVFAYYYLQKILTTLTITLCSSNVHRLTAAAFLISAKFLDDAVYSNNFYARVFGFTLPETNIIETTFLQEIQYDLWDQGAKNLSDSLAYPLCD